jgi:hypothetical protein
MILRYRNDFLESYYQDTDRNIRLYQYKLLGAHIDDLENIDVPEITRNSSPTIGYYEFSGILSGTDLQVSLSPDVSDYSVESYREILVYYEDPETSEIGLAFVIDLEDSENLRRTVNILEIPDFEPSCQVSFERSLDTTRLEGAGQGRYRNFLGLSDEDLRAYVTLESWRAYHQLNKSTDSNTSNFLLDHLDTVKINEYGLKIY